MSDIPTTRLGCTGLTVSRMGFGAATIASLNTRHTAAEVRATLHAAVDAGINFFDTADLYGQGDSERLLGQLRRERGDDIVVSTKVGLELATSQQLLRLAKPVLQPLLRHWPAARSRSIRRRRSEQRHCGDVSELRQRVHGSLRRLQTERLDLLLLHSPPPQWSGRDDLRQLLADLARDGLVRHSGVSVQSLHDTPQWLGWAELDCIQLPLTPEPGADGRLNLSPAARTVVQLAAGRGVGVVAREVLAGGQLAHDAASCARALDAVLSTDGVASVLVGMGCRQHLQDNLHALHAALHAETVS